MGDEQFPSDADRAARLERLEVMSDEDRAAAGVLPPDPWGVTGSLRLRRRRLDVFERDRREARKAAWLAKMEGLRDGKI